MAAGVLVVVQSWCMFSDLILRGGVKHGGGRIGGGAVVVHVLSFGFGAGRGAGVGLCFGLNLTWPTDSL